MNTYFRKNISIIPVYKGGHKIHKDDLLITAFDNKIYFIDTNNGKIENEITYNAEVTSFTEHNYEIIVGLSDGTLIHGNKTHKIHKTKIACIKSINNNIVTTSFDKTMKVSNEAFETIGTVYCKNCPLQVVDSDQYIITYDVESNVYLYEKLGGKRYRFCVLNDLIVKVLFQKGIVYIFHSGSICKVYFSKNMGKQQTNLFLGNKNNDVSAGSLDYDIYKHKFNIADAIINDEIIYAIGETSEVIHFNLDCKNIKTHAIKISGVECKDLEFKNIEYRNDLVLSTTEDEIFYLDNNYEIKNVIIGNNDEITDFCIHKDMIFIATNSGRLRYTNVTDIEGQYACMGQILEAHCEAIMCIKFYYNYFVTSSRDKKLKIWRIVENEHNIKKIKYNNDIKIELVREIETHIESVNSCDITANIVASVGKDQTLQIFKYMDGFEQTVNKTVHNKEINCVRICEQRRVIVTASQDKTLKVFDFTGTELAIMTGHRKGVWSFDIGKDILVSCSSDETIRVWSLNDFSCIKILEGFDCKILKVKLFNEDSKIIATGMNGIVKVFDIKKNKVVGTFNVHQDKIWALLYHEMSIITGSSDGVLCMQKNETKENNSEIKRLENEEKEMKFEIEKSIKNKDFLNALKISYGFNNIDEIYRLIVECINHQFSIDEIFIIFEKDN